MAAGGVLYLLRQLGQASADHLVIVASERVPGDVTHRLVDKRVWRGGGQIVHAHAQHPQRACMQQSRVETLVDVATHVGHVAVQLALQPLVKFVRVVGQIGVRDGQFLKAKVISPITNLFDVHADGHDGLQIRVSALQDAATENVFSQLCLCKNHPTETAKSLLLNCLAVQDNQSMKETLDEFDRLYTGLECREIDRLAIEEHGIAGLTLIRRAGRFAFDVLRTRWPDVEAIDVVCGSGNNAGDGYVVAGLARSHGFDVKVHQIGEVQKLRGEAARACEWMTGQGIEIHGVGEFEGQLIVDAMLGTGVTGDIRSPYVEVIDHVNASGLKVLAMDLPSGISPDTGGKLTPRPVTADATTMFITPKLGMFTGAGVNHCGELYCSKLEVPDAVFERVKGVTRLPRHSRSHYLPARVPGSHKHQSGHVLVIGGTFGFGGAALLASEAAMKTGAGLVTAITDSRNVEAFLARCPEVMVREVEEGENIAQMLERADAVAIGPGLGQSAWGSRLLAQVLGTELPKVIDADALRLLADDPDVEIKNAVLTPHPGEAAALLDTTTAEIERDRLCAAAEISSRYDAIAILKGAGTLIGVDGDVSHILTNANPALGTAGSGDVLTGIVAASAAQLNDMHSAACTGVCMHARAGELAHAQLDGGVVLARDLIEAIRPWIGAA